MRQEEATPSHSTTAQPEEVHTNYCYPKTYKKVRSLREQINHLADEFGIGRFEALALAKRLPSKPMFGEGWFACAKTSAVIKRHFPSINTLEEQHCKVIEFGHKILSRYHPFGNCSSLAIVPKNIQQHPRTRSFVARIETEQPGDIVIIAAQHGLYHRGRSTKAVYSTMHDNEFGLDSFWVACMGITHPERYHSRDELDAECPGDRLPIKSDLSSTMVPHYSFSGGRLGYCVGDASEAYERLGPVTGFI